MLRIKDEMLRDSKNQVTLVAFLTFSSGCLLDHLTTLYGLTIPTIGEANPWVNWLMEWGIWHEFEIGIILSIGIFQVFSTYLTRSRAIYSLSIIGVTSVGLIRYFAAIHNIVIIVQTLS